MGFSQGLLAGVNAFSQIDQQRIQREKLAQDEKDRQDTLGLRNQQLILQQHADDRAAALQEKQLAVYGQDFTSKQRDNQRATDMHLAEMGDPTAPAYAVTAYKQGLDADKAKLGLLGAQTNSANASANASNAHGAYWQAQSKAVGDLKSQKARDDATDVATLKSMLAAQPKAAPIIASLYNGDGASPEDQNTLYQIGTLPEAGQRLKQVYSGSHVQENPDILNALQAQGRLVPRTKQGAHGEKVNDGYDVKLSTRPGIGAQTVPLESLDFKVVDPGHRASHIDPKTGKAVTHFQDFTIQADGLPPIKYNAYATEGMSPKGTDPVREVDAKEHLQAIGQRLQGLDKFYKMADGMRSAGATDDQIAATMIHQGIFKGMFQDSVKDENIAAGHVQKQLETVYKTLDAETQKKVDYAISQGNDPAEILARISQPVDDEAEEQ